MNLSGEMTKTIVGRNIRYRKSDKEKWNEPMSVRKVNVSDEMNREKERQTNKQISKRNRKLRYQKAQSSKKER